MTSPTDSQHAIHEAVQNILEAAEAFGDADGYIGRRNTPRLAEGLQLEVTTDSQSPTETWAVSMHNVSETGISFWSRRNIEQRDLLFVRQFDSSTPGPWLPVRVKHVTVGIRGNLIGSEFEFST